MATRDKILIALILLWYAVTLFWFRAGLDWTGHRLSATLGLVTFLAAFVPFGALRSALGIGKTKNHRHSGTGEERRTKNSAVPALILLAALALTVVASIVDFPLRTPAFGLLLATLAGLAAAAS